VKYKAEPNRPTVCAKLMPRGYKQYSSYKDSGVEWLSEIPEQWGVKKFQYLFRIKKRIAGDIGFKILSITQKGIKVKDIESGQGQLSSDYSKYQHVMKGDYAMNHMDLLTGYVDLSIYDGVTSPDYRVFTLEDTKSDAEFYLFYLQMGYVNKIFYPFGQGSSEFGRWRLPTDAFKEFLAPNPSLQEQKTIANYLDKATAKIDTLIEKQSKLIALLKEKRQAVISSAVTRGLDASVPMKDSGVEWLGEIPEHWETSPMKYLGRFINGYAFSSGSFSEIGVKVLKITNIQHMRIDWKDVSYINDDLYNELPLFRAYKNDLVFALTRPIISTGIKVGLIETNEKILINQRNSIYRATKVITKFMYYLLLNKLFINEFESKIDATGQQPNISHVDIGNISIPLPAEQQQHEIVEYLEFKVSQLDNLVTKSTQSIGLLKEKRTALISAAVTGKIDVRDAA